MKTANVKYPTTGNYMQFDIWIPEYQLSFEFQVLKLFLHFRIIINYLWKRMLTILYLLGTITIRKNIFKKKIVS